MIWSATHKDCTFIDNCEYDKSMKPFYQQESVMNAALNHYFHTHDENRRKVSFNGNGPFTFEFLFQGGLSRKQKKIFALVKLMKKLNEQRSFFIAKIPKLEPTPEPTPRPKTKDRGRPRSQIA